jgi:endonuclease YncB( thermonuclease family)
MIQIGMTLAVLAAVVSCSHPEPPGQVFPQAVDTTKVIRVIDGDTIEGDNGRKIRVLGIDSCKNDTLGGKRATEQANRILAGKIVTVEKEGTVENDRFGRELRYVILPSGEDYAALMVVEDHTEAYKGGDASREYQNKMKVLDSPPRQCEV